MSQLLLTGAGFTRNWGGWLSNEAFEFLLGCSEMDEYIRLSSFGKPSSEAVGLEDTLSKLQDVMSLVGSE